MNFTGINLAFSAYNINDARFSFVPAFAVNIKQVFVVASEEIGNCTFDKIEWKKPDNFEVSIIGLKREYIGQKVDFKFHLIWSNQNDRIFKQTLSHHRDKAELSYPLEINLNTI